MLLFYMFVVLFSTTVSGFYPNRSLLQVKSSANIRNDRPIWFGTHRWNCGQNLGGALRCKEGTIEISRCNCMFYNNITYKTEFGTCLYTCFNPQRDEFFDVNRYAASNYSTFNIRMCNYYFENITIESNRTGRFCGQCLSGHGLAVYSYHLSSCIPCHYSRMNWVKYFSIALLPLTGLYCLVAMLGINLAAGKMNGLIFSIQIIMAPFNLLMVDSWIHGRTIKAENFFKLGMAFLGPSNLDFFRDVYPKFCISPRFNILHILALDYIVALYPFLLIFLTYVLIKLYDKDYTVVVWAWKPFKYMLQGKSYRGGTSLVETFCTFILLSSMKILTVSILLLSKTKAYDESGGKLNKNYLYLDASIEFFSSEHRHFGLLAIFIAFTFVLLPFLLLILYPCRCFQRLLNYCGGNFQALHVFMDAFQGSYRTGPVDLRYFSAYYMVIRCILQFVQSFFQSFFILSITTVLLIMSSIIFAAVKPYKEKFHNQVDLLCLLFLTLLYASLTLMHFTFFLDITWIILADTAFASSLLLVVFCYIAMFSYAMFGRHLKKIKFVQRERQGSWKTVYNIIIAIVEYFYPY